MEASKQPVGVKSEIRGMGLGGWSAIGLRPMGYRENFVIRSASARRRLFWSGMDRMGDIWKLSKVCPGRLKCSATAVLRLREMSDRWSVHLSLRGLLVWPMYSK